MSVPNDTSQVVIDGVLVSLGTLRLQPGDILAVLADQMLSGAQSERIGNLIKDMVPEGVRVVVLVGGMTLARVTFGGDVVSP